MGLSYCFCRGKDKGVYFNKHFGDVQRDSCAITQHVIEKPYIHEIILLDDKRISYGEYLNHGGEKLAIWNSNTLAINLDNINPDNYTYKDTKSSIELWVLGPQNIKAAEEFEKRIEGMTEEEFIGKKPNLEKYAVKDSYLSNAVMNIVDSEENKDLTYFYTERITQLTIIDWLTFGRVNGYYYYLRTATRSSSPDIFLARRTRDSRYRR